VCHRAVIIVVGCTGFGRKRALLRLKGSHDSTLTLAHGTPPLFTGGSSRIGQGRPTQNGYQV